MTDSAKLYWAALREGVGDPKRFFLGVFGVFAAFVAVAWVAREPIQAFAEALIDAWGLLGIFTATLVGEIVPPIGFQPALILGHTGGIGPASLFATVEGGSFVASLVCWVIGAGLRTFPAAVAWLDRRKAATLFKKHGAAAVGIAALTPMPYGAITLVGAALGMPFLPAVRGMTLRPIKIGLSLLVLWLGWAR